MIILKIFYTSIASIVFVLLMCLQAWIDRNTVNDVSSVLYLILFFISSIAAYVTLLILIWAM